MNTIANVLAKAPAVVFAGIVALGILDSCSAHAAGQDGRPWPEQSYTTDSAGYSGFTDGAGRYVPACEGNALFEGRMDGHDSRVMVSPHPYMLMDRLECPEDAGLCVWDKSPGADEWTARPGKLVEGKVIVTGPAIGHVRQLMPCD